MRLDFQCNLDLARPDVNRLNIFRYKEMPVPRKGETITFTFIKNGQGFSFHLEVISVSYNYFSQTIEVELYISSDTDRSFAEWSAWFKEFRYGK